DPNVKALFDVFIDAWFEQAAEGEESEEDVNDDPVEPDSGLAIVEDSGDEVHDGLDGESVSLETPDLEDDD
ncbi:unnamed protein product, partial [Symbiodinium pilosum]